MIGAQEKQGVKLSDFLEKTLDNFRSMIYNSEAVKRNAAIAQQVERILGKDEVASSNLASSSKKALEPQRFWGFCFFAENLTAKKTTTKTTT